VRIIRPEDSPVLLFDSPHSGRFYPDDFRVPGVEAQSGPLSVADVRHRIDLVYKPYHEALIRLLDEIRAERGFVWHLNWHSMKSVGNAMTPDGAERADFVVSDVRSRSADPRVTELVVENAAGLGLHGNRQ